MPPSEDPNPNDRRPALRRTVIRPAGSPPEPGDAAFVSDRLTIVAHELANLLDGSMRCLGLAQRSLAESTPPRGKPASPGELQRRLETVYVAMAQMADIVRALASGGSIASAGALRWSGGGPAVPGDDSPPNLAEAIEHAADVLRPLAHEKGIQVEVQLSDAVMAVHAGSLYTVIADAVRNAIEAIDAAGDGRGGLVRVIARVEPSAAGGAPGAGMVYIEVIDDGIGPPNLAPRDRAAVFDYGFTTKPRGTGIGLALARDVVTELGGMIDLVPRTDTPAGKAGGPARAHERRGALLRIVYPVPDAARPDIGQEGHA